MAKRIASQESISELFSTEPKTFYEAVNKLFDGDDEEAVYEANLIHKRYANPPAWVVDYLGLPNTWKDPVSHCMH